MILSSHAKYLSIGRWAEISRRHSQDARVLLSNERYLGAIYLMGYAIECTLKMLIVKQISPLGSTGQNAELEISFSGKTGHDLIKLFESAVSSRNSYKKMLRTDLIAFNKNWSVELRYSTKPYSKKEAFAILNLADKILKNIRDKG